ncbi:hypothetical protein Patl1_27944 [Pistacia atlantica]|uniref:Uncharacterized protein n=1 Tax=Pistacia atlantica TaxID=434234 RepID=A0ACC1BDE3_9ROSI|nr:hypothetical protein Patl1_27944 [Pistacia atlantica]
MAEAAVEFAIKTLGSLLVQEVKLLGSAKKEVESIKSELESMRSCLTNADATAAAEEEGEGDECVKTWGIDDVLEKIKESKIRSICLFDVDKLPRSFMSAFPANCKLLKVLDFEDAPMDYLPDGVGKLFHLHYLSLKSTNVKELPKSIGMLINLETLDLKWLCVAMFDCVVSDLEKRM